MKPFVAIFALLFSMSTHAAVTITNAEFVLTLGGDWVRVPSSDTNQFSFESKSNKTSVVLSLTPLSISQDKLVEVAGAIEQREIAVQMQVDELGAHSETGPGSDIASILSAR